MRTAMILLVLVFVPALALAAEAPREDRRSAASAGPDFQLAPGVLLGAGGDVGGHAGLAIGTVGTLTLGAIVIGSAVLGDALSMGSGFTWTLLGVGTVLDVLVFHALAEQAGLHAPLERRLGWAAGLGLGLGAGGALVGYAIGSAEDAHCTFVCLASVAYGLVGGIAGFSLGVNLGIVLAADSPSRFAGPVVAPPHRDAVAALDVPLLAGTF